MNPSKSLHLVPIWSANDPTVGSFWWYKSTFKRTYKTLWVHLNDLFPKRPNGRVVSKQTFLFVTHCRSTFKCNYKTEWVHLKDFFPNDPTVGLFQNKLFFM